jgi:hypothetical protein
MKDFAGMKRVYTRHAGAIGLSELVDHLGSGFRAEMSERVTAAHAAVCVASQEVWRDIGEFKTSL